VLAIGTGMLVLPGVVSTANAANPLTLYVTVDGFDGPNDCTLAARPCRTLRHALRAAGGSEATNRDVVITMGPGRYVPNSTTDHIASGVPSSLTITGAGPTQTVLTMPPATTGNVVGLSVGKAFTARVTVSSLSFVGAAPNAQLPGNAGGFATGIHDAGPGLLTVADVRIDDLTGGNGTPSVDAAIPGGEGGSVFGVDRTGGPTALRNTVITGLHGGTGAPGAGIGSGGDGGSATGVSSDAALSVTGSSISQLLGGNAGNSADGGNAYSIAVEPGQQEHPVTVLASELSDNVGGAGGAGVRGARDKDGANGGKGGEGVGLCYVGPSLVIADSTLSGHRGGRGGAGGRGGDATGNAGAGGVGGQGGSAVGLLSNTQDGLATTSVTDSTASDNQAGAGGAGGMGGIGRTGRGGDGGDGGDAGSAGAGLMPMSGRNGVLTNSAVHLTALGNLGSTGGAAGKAGNGLTPGVDGTPGAGSHTVAGLASNAWTTLSASLLDNAGHNCVLLADAPLTDAGWNITSDGSCLRAGQGSRQVAGVAADVGAPADNGGPTHTQAIPGDSPAANAVAVSSGLCGGTEATDQRGMPRPGHAAPDHCAAGAFEPHRVIPGAS
jgi:hypothetical protein